MRKCGDLSDLNHWTACWQKNIVWTRKKHNFLLFVIRRKKNINLPFREFLDVKSQMICELLICKFQLKYCKNSHINWFNNCVHWKENHYKCTRFEFTRKFNDFTCISCYILFTLIPHFLNWCFNWDIFAILFLYQVDISANSFPFKQIFLVWQIFCVNFFSSLNKYLQK